MISLKNVTRMDLCKLVSPVACSNVQFRIEAPQNTAEICNTGISTVGITELVSFGYLNVQIKRN